jgi:3,4-dihydroxy 2-butanone 4-phosphate synthase/GTP cyclohydrolase II
MALATIEDAISDYAAGKMVIIVDDEDRENEGDLVCAAQFVTPQVVNFMAKEGRGLICLAITGERLDELEIPMMVGSNNSKFGTNFTVSIEAAHGVTTGISAADRAHTIQTVINPLSKPADIAMPGHVFPLRAVAGGVLRRAGQTEASVDLAKLSGLYPAGVICEIMNDDGTMARLPELEIFAAKHDLKIISVEQLIRFRREREILVRRTAEARLPTVHGEWTIMSYESDLDLKEAIALVMGDISTDEPVLVRVHSECLTGDAFGSLRCDCGPQLDQAMAQIAAEGRGVLLYLRQEGRGIGLPNKIRAYRLQDEGLDTIEANEKLGFPADLRDYGVGAQILADLHLRDLRLLTNNPKKIIGFEGFGLHVVEQMPLHTTPNAENMAYLRTKRERMGHTLMTLDHDEPGVPSLDGARD